MTKPTDLHIELQIKRDRHDENYHIDVASMPVRNANYSIHSYKTGNEKQ